MNFTATGILRKGLKQPREVSASRQGWWSNKRGHGPGKGGKVVIEFLWEEWRLAERMGHGAGLEGDSAPVG